MTRALVLMKAMPPTKGHERLIDFARGFSDRGVVLMDYAPDEPMIQERKAWLDAKVPTGITGWYSWALECNDQDPESEGFWERWRELVSSFGRFDYVIGSEGYCEKVAEVIGARYIPYDPDREIAYTKATNIRDDPFIYFDEIAPGFQKHLKTTITVFGAESTGKTTLSKELARALNGEWTFEWARPYLEGTGQTVVDLQAMIEIWHGQYAAERNADRLSLDKPFIVRDTDLYSTIGYWEQPHWQSDLGPVPRELVSDANFHKSDLYIITSSNIPFEKDPLRYGGDHRESPDSYWIEFAEKYNLPYVVLTSDDRQDRLYVSFEAANEAFYKKSEQLHYNRELVES